MKSLAENHLNLKNRNAPNAPSEQAGLHGAVWFETLYKDPNDKTDKTLFAYIITKITPLLCHLIHQPGLVI
jgi:hypothetical protein